MKIVSQRLLGTLVFKKWKRKGYAIFASLNKVVKIGQLTIDICKTSFCKIKSLLSLLNFKEEVGNEEDDFVKGESLPDLLDALLLLERGELSTGHAKRIFINTYNKSPLVAECS